MSGVYLWFALCLSAFTGNMMYEPSIFLCDTLIEGSTCSSKGMAVYVSQGDTPTRPSTFYPISHTQWAFTASSNSKYLGISSSDYPNISGKFSGVFTAPKSATFTFLLVLTHTVTNGACYLSLSECPLFMEADLSYSGTGKDSGYSCYYTTSTSCSSDASYTYKYTMRRIFTFVKGSQYPLFAGMRHVTALPVTTAAPWLKLTYYTSSVYYQARVGKEAVAGLSGYTDTSTTTKSSSSSAASSGNGSSAITSSAASSSSGSSGDSPSEDDGSSTTASNLKKTNGAVVGGACAGVIVVVAAAAVGLWVLFGGKSGKKRTLLGFNLSSRKESNGSLRSGSRSGSGRTSRESRSRGGSRSTSRESRSRGGSGRTSRESRSRGGSGRSSRQSRSRGSSGRTSRESRSRGVSGRSSRQSRSRGGSGRTSRESRSRGVSGRSSRQSRSRGSSGRTSRDSRYRDSVPSGPVFRVGN